jgi:para-aminobenzoate synthetase / 4-amino-4-deoxychorismate lyase
LPLSAVEPRRYELRSALAPAQVLPLLAADLQPFALAGEWLLSGAVTILGSAPVRLADERSDDPFALLGEQPTLNDSDEVLIGGGWVGWLGYLLGALIEELPPGPPPARAKPAFQLAFYDHLVIHDGEHWWWEELWTAERAAVLEERRELWQARLLAEPTGLQALLGSPELAMTANGAAGHLVAVSECVERIAAGELYQANLCLRLAATLDPQPNPFALLARALPAAKPRFGAAFTDVVSLSPERFLRRSDRAVSSEPIKGTRPRQGSADELSTSAKDAAEHVMIVDLMRNDLGRVCEYGSVAAQPPRVEGHAGVWHLVSTVTGELRADATDADLLRATFPPGSVTGAPKVQAMKVIAELEATRRELYTGAIGIASPLAGLDLSVAIRTFECSDDQIWIGVGGGIVADSDPHEELAEALAKAAGPLAAIGAVLAAPRTELHSARVVRGLPRALDYGPRPDPTRGVFETVLLEGGELEHLHAHLQRLAASAYELYGVTFKDALERRLRMSVAGNPGRGRMRVRMGPTGGVDAVLSSEAPANDEPLQLSPFLLPGGLGAHKWQDRDLLEALASASGAVPLLVDSDGLVLEAAHANVWIVEGEALITPPADGRILPGVTRAALMAAEPLAREEQIDLQRLHDADEIFLTSAISRRRPAHLPH